MAVEERVSRMVAELERARAGDLKKRAAEIKVDHDLALELWATGLFHARLLATLILSKKRIDAELIDRLAADMMDHPPTERDNLSDWFLANQLMKDKRLASLIGEWEESDSPILRRLFWYHQARLRWTGQAPPDNTGRLVDALEAEMEGAHPTVQWAMNFCACQIALHEPEFRPRCLALGERLGLYKGDHVSKNCTPSYLPDFVRIELGKRKKD